MILPGGDGKSVVGAAGLLAKFKAIRDRINNYYLTAERRNVGGQNVGSNDARGSRIATRAAKDGKARRDRKNRKQGDEIKDPNDQFENLFMGKPSTFALYHHDLRLDMTNVDLTLTLAERKAMLPTEVTLKALATAQSAAVALAKRAFDHNPEALLDNLAKRKQVERQLR